MPFYLYIILNVHIGHWCIIAICIGKKLTNHSYNCSVSTVGSIAKLFFFSVQNTRVEFDWVCRKSVQTDRPLFRIRLQIIPRQTADRQRIDSC